MAYANKEREKEYQRQYYLNHTRLKRLTGEYQVKSYYVKKSPEELAKIRSEAGKKAAKTLRERIGEEAYRAFMSECGKAGIKKQKEVNGKIGFQNGYAREAQLLGAKARKANRRKKNRNGKSEKL